jgi:hypothetical protein
MVLFVLYIEPLIRAINAQFSGFSLQQDYVKTLAHADEINFIVKNDSEMDAVFEIFYTFCTKSHAAINFNKFKFLSIDFLNAIQDLIKENTNQQGSISRLKHPSKEI